MVGGAAYEIILGCQAFGLLSEQGVAKNSSEGRGGAQWDTERDRGREGETQGTATKMDSKGEELGLKGKDDDLRQ